MPRVQYMVDVFDSFGHRFEALYLHEAPHSLFDTDDKAAQCMCELCHSYSKRLLAEADFQCAVCSQNATDLFHQPGLFVGQGNKKGLVMPRDLPAPTCCAPSCKEIVKQRTHEIKKCVLPKAFREFQQCAACGTPHCGHWPLHKIACRGPKEQFIPASHPAVNTSCRPCQMTCRSRV